MLLMCPERPRFEEPSEEFTRQAQNWARRRREELGLAAQNLKERGGPERTVVAAFENEGRWPARGTTRTKYGLSLQWPPDAFDRMAQGLPPVPEELEQREKDLRKMAEDLKTAIDRWTDEALKPR